jgi:hypothetical protein
MRLESARIMTIAAVAGLCLAAPAAAQRQVVEGMSQRLTVACGPDGVKVQGMSNTVTLTGPCGVVLVEGNNNTVHIAELGRLTVAGMNNKVYWSNGIDGATPKITKEGIGNSVERKTPADSDAAPSRPQTTTRSGGTAGATASSPTSSATATAAPGNPTLNVGSGDRKVSRGAGAGGARVRAKSGAPAPARPPAASGASTAPSAGSGLPILVPNNQQVKTMECEGRPVSVQGNGNRLTLKGLCGPITVGGNDNILNVGSTTRIDTSGNRNVVKYRDLVDDKAPVVTSGGNGNRVSRTEPQ